MASLNESVKHITKHGLARTNRFNVIISLPEILQQVLNSEKSEDSEGGNFLRPLIGSVDIELVKSYLGSGTEIVRGLDIMCESAQFPSKSLSVSETKYNSDYFSAAHDITYTPVEFTFVVSRDFLEKNIIDKWMNIIIDPVTHDISYFNTYVSPSIEIQQLNELDQVTHKVIIKDAFPVDISTMQLSNESNDEYHKMTVSFVYRKWVSSEVEQPSGVGSLAQTPLGPLTTPILSNPAVQSGIDFVENQFLGGASLEGQAVDIYNMVDDVVKNTTGQSTNKTASLLNGIKANLDLNNLVSSDQKAQLIGLIDGTLDKLGQN
jgi:hypothetical protein